MKDSTPAELDPSAELLDAQVVEAIWTEWIANSTHVVPDGEIYEYCEGGEGTVIQPRTLPELQGTTFRWRVEKRPGSQWNIAFVAFDEHAMQGRIPDNAEPFSGITLDPSSLTELGGLEQPLFHGPGQALFFFETTCGQ